jgi:biopolymer transport protein ExbB
VNGLLNSDLVREALVIWQSGGWAMYALAVDALCIFGLGSYIMMKLVSRGLYQSPDRLWKAWIDDPDSTRGPLAPILRRAMACGSLEGLDHFFAGLNHDELAPFERDLKAMMVCVSAAPLLGLLGTVTGMLTTFHALATGGGGDQTMSMIAAGISEALITTESGLVLALSGMIFQFVLVRQHGQYEKVITHLQTLCVQHYQRKTSGRQAA